MQVWYNQELGAAVNRMIGDMLFCKTVDLQLTVFSKHDCTPLFLDSEILWHSNANEYDEQPDSWIQQEVYDVPSGSAKIND